MKIDVPFESPVIVIGYAGIFLHQYMPSIFLRDGSRVKLDTARNLHEAYKNAFKKFKEITIKNGDERELSETNTSIEDYAIGKFLEITIEELSSANRIMKIQSPMIDKFHTHDSAVEYQANKKIIEYFEMLLKDVRSI